MIIDVANEPLDSVDFTPLSEAFEVGHRPCCRQDGSPFAMEVEHGEVRRGDRSVTLAFVRDISERKAYAEGLEHRALHDPLTGLANRTLFGEHVLQALASAQRSNESRVVLVMNLDGFKQVNDKLGHGGGDILPQQVAKRLTAALRQTDMIAKGCAVHALAGATRPASSGAASFTPAC
jgi:predicted signal transduction protein with EAL and GGDEF domain